MSGRSIRQALGAAALIILAACNTPQGDSWDRLEKGMTKEQVEVLLGKPSSSFEARKDGDEVIVAFDRWQYGDKPSTLATGIVFPTEAPDNVYAVYFDTEGKVIDFRRPISQE